MNVVVVAANERGEHQGNMGLRVSLKAGAKGGGGEWAMEKPVCKRADSEFRSDDDMGSLDREAGRG